MKIISKKGTFDSDPTLHMVRTESGVTIIYAAEPDETIQNIWRRSVL